MSSSTFTPNLGIEQPATGMYANTWGNVANRSYAVIDAAIGGNAQIVIAPTNTLTTGQGTDPSNGVYPLIIWTGPQSAQGVVTIAPNTEQRLYIMSNQTSGGFPIAFQQGTGTQFVLQPGYAAQIYCDGAGANASVAGALANPQFANVLVTGSLMVEGNLSSSSGSLSFQDVTVSALGIGNPVSMPDQLVVNGAGPTSSIRLVMAAGNNCAAILSNDGDYFYLLTTVAANPYGAALGPPHIPIWVDLANNVIGLAGAQPNVAYALSAPSIHCTSLAADAGITCLQLAANGAVMVDAAAVNAGGGAQIDLVFGGNTEGISSPRTTGAANQNGLTFFTASQPRMYITNSGQVGIMRGPDAGHALCVSGLIHTTSGIVFPDGSIQTTAVSGTFTQLTVNGNGTISGSLSVGGSSSVSGSMTVGSLTGPSVSPALKIAQTQNGLNLPNGSIGFSIDNLSELVVWWRNSSGVLWRAALSFTTQWQQWTGPVQ